jgi:hypothetical protein
MYAVTVNYNNQDIPVYVSLDGKYLLPQAIPLTGNAVADTTNTVDAVAPTPTVVPKTDKPKVELFIMTHCPYGTQAEKGIIPAVKALGDKVDFTIRFVHYFMHGDKEETETYNQVCIREEQSAKYISYLECFLEDGNSDRCITKVGVDKAKMTGCVSTKAKEYYAADSKLSESYGVQGSPTLIINGAEAEFYPRSPSNAATAICAAFNNQPTLCSSNSLSTSGASAGFGYGTAAASGTAASCG